METEAVIERPVGVLQSPAGPALAPGRSDAPRLTVLPGGRNGHQATGHPTVAKATAPALLEREAEMDALVAAAVDAAAGCGSVVLVTGEAGSGKTSVVRAFLDVVLHDFRVLSGACDDLVAPRTLGPLRDAVVGTGGPLERAFAADRSGDAVFAAVTEELVGPEPRVLVVEDVHWADDGTLDVLRFVARRLNGLRVVLVLTFRDEAGHSLRQLLGALASAPVHRLALPALSAAAVGALSSGSGHDPATLHALTRGNPFYVAEVLAAPGEQVPATVVDTVLARVRRLGPDARAACEQLSVVPSHVGFELAGSLFGSRLDALAEAEEHGVVEVRPEGIVFRHELARRAVECALPTIRRRNLNRAVVQALRTQDSPDLARLVHHAVHADDGATVLGYAPLAGRQAARAGSHRQALAHFEAALRYADRLPDAQRAALVDDYAWELHIAHRFTDAVAAGREAAVLRERVGEPVALGETLLRLSRHLYLAGCTDDAEAAVERAAQVLEPTGSGPALASAATYRGATLALTGRCADAVTALERARTLAVEAGRTDLVALCLNYLGVARADLGGPHGLHLLRESLATATTHGDHESAARAYTNLAELLYRDGRWDELAGCLDAGLAFTRERGFRSHAYNLEVHRALLLMRRGEWAGAQERLRGLVEGVADPGMFRVQRPGPGTGASPPR
jgi:tetratricopeptide (TPR) repeat protein